MRYRLVALPILLASGGCHDSKPPGPPERIKNPDTLPGLPAMGRERRIVVVADGILSGEGLAAQDRYPARIEAALRAHGVNARVSAITPKQLAALPTDPALRPELIVADRMWSGMGASVLVPDFGKVLAGGPPDEETVGDMVAASRERIARALPPR